MQTGSQFKDDKISTKAIGNEEVLPDLCGEAKSNEEKIAEPKVERIQTEKSRPIDPLDFPRRV